VPAPRVFPQRAKQPATSECQTRSQKKRERQRQKRDRREKEERTRERKREKERERKKREIARETRDREREKFIGSDYVGRVPTERKLARVPAPRVFTREPKSLLQANITIDHRSQITEREKERDE